MNVSVSFYKILLVLSVGFFLGISPTLSFAQDDEDDKPAPEQPAASHGKTAHGRPVKNKRVEVNFEDQLIKGEVQKPELFYLLQKKQFNFSKLIKLRENFLPEMKKTAEDIPRGVED